MKAAIASFERGRFRDALNALKAEAVGSIRHAERELLHTDLLQKTGDVSHATRRVDDLLAQEDLSASQRARCLTIDAVIALEAGDDRRAIEYLTQAINLAKGRQALGELCWAKLRLLVATSQRNQVAESLITDIRRHVIRLGDLQTTIALHLFITEIDTQRGALQSAAKHLRVANALLENCDNLWLSGLAEIDGLCLAFLNGNLQQARLHAQRAAEVALQSGHIKTQLAAISDIAHIDLTEGRVVQAERSLRRALAMCRATGTSPTAVLDGLAQLDIAKGDYRAAQKHLEQISVSPGAEQSYQKLSARLTQIRLWLRLGEADRAKSGADGALVLAQGVGDNYSGWLFRLLRAEASAVLGMFADAARDILAAAAERDDVSLDLLAEIQRVTGRSLAREGDRAGAIDAYDRATRILHALGHTRRHADVQQEAVAETATSAASVEPGPEPSPSELPLGTGPEYRGDLLLRRAVAALEQAARPDLLGLELLGILLDCRCAHAGAVVRNVNGRFSAYHSIGWTDAQATAAAVSPDPPAIPLGTWRDAEWIVVSEVAPSVVARTAWMAVHRLAASGLALAAARLEARERQALWPIDNPDDPSPGVFISEQMVELARIARRVAAAPVTVLLTGETGVGKEVFAHMIHDASPRAGKVFVPFNCAAVPRDLIESQLFGHRKGAFTGADHSSHGVIRSASGGTLFLDEIGEVPLDLQAKLLRFLELGEVHPLGDPQPMRADVRVVAATNQELDALVKSGRFREDLYYRLNVVRLTIPPLRERREEIPRFAQLFLERFAREQHKGRLRIADETLEYLVLYNWPGNVRELMNEMKRMAAFAEADAILMPEHLKPELSASRRTRPPSERELLPTELVVRIDQPLAAATEHLERAMIQHAMARYQGHVEQVARALGLSRKGLYLKRRRLGFDVGNEGGEALQSA